MIVERWTWIVGHQRHREFIELAKAAVAETGLTPRICSYVFGPKDVVSSDLEFETEQDRQKYWDGIDWNQPDLAKFLEQYADLAESGATCELLQVH